MVPHEEEEWKNQIRQRVVAPADEDVVALVKGASWIFPRVAESPILGNNIFEKRFEIYFF